MTYIDIETARGMMLCRGVDAHKGSMGHALLVAGSYGMAGAAVLASRACLRSGVGKCTVHTAWRNNDIIQISVPEAIMSADRDERVVTDVVDVSRYDAVGIGPGLGTDGRTAEAVLGLLGTLSVPAVVDADALNILSGNADRVSSLGGRMVFTPHLKELQRLCVAFGVAERTEVRWGRAEAVECALRLARLLGVYVIVKGPGSALCCPDGDVVVNTSGNAGMATAGSGDVLTGVIAGLLARGYEVRSAAMLGMLLHGLAGDKANEALGMESLVAGDIVRFLPDAFKCVC